VNRIIKSQLIQSNKAKPYGPEKCPILLKLLYIGADSKLIKKNIVDITSRSYFSVNPRVLFTSKPILHRSEKTQRHQKKRVLLYTNLNATAKVATLGKLLKTTIKEHVPKCITSYISDRKDKKSAAVKNAMKNRP